MRCAIMQPTYLPWAGYFSMIENVDVFIFFDDVQFSRRSWQQRNRINLNQQEKWLTIPVKKTGLRDQLINKVEVVDDKWKTTHFNLIKQAYGKSKYFDEVYTIFEEAIIKSTTNLLAEINVNFIMTVMKYLNINTKILYSSNLKSEGKKSQYLLNICKEINADTYISAPGSMKYIEGEGYFENSNIKVEKFEFEPKCYSTKNADSFIPYLSILDVIANLGVKESYTYIKK